MLKVKDIMTRELITVSPQTEIASAAKILLEKRINGLPVIDDSGKLVGILWGDGDVGDILTFELNILTLKNTAC